MGCRIGIVALGALALTGCGENLPADRVMYVAADDPRMNAAIEKARSTVNTFIAALESPKPGQSGFSVKMAFTDGSNTEHIWLFPVSYDGANFHGTVANEPRMVANVKFGQKVAVAPR